MIRAVNRSKLFLVDIFRKTNALKFYHEFLKTQWLSYEQIKKMQWEKLIKLLHHAYKNVPYFHKLFVENDIHPHDIKSINDFRKIPVLTKDIIIENFEDMLSKNIKIFKPYKKSTGGSTGKPLIYFMDRKSRSAQWATLYRLWHIGGWNPGEKIVYLGGTSLFPSLAEFKKGIYAKLNNWLVLSAFHMSDYNMQQWVNEIRRSGAKFMYSYANSAYILANFIKDNNIKDIPIKAVFTTCEPLLPKYRETIENVFSCDVFDFYGANDGGGYAFECDVHKGLHCVSEKCFIEVVKEDGAIAGDGEIGEIVSTDLLNYAMPFIRYKVEDLAIVDSSLCKCGRSLPLLKNIIGRSHDFITSKHGDKVHGFFFSYMFQKINWINQFYVVQKNDEELSVYLKPNYNPPPEEVKYIESLLKRKFTGMQIEIIITKNLPKTSGSKFRYVINKTLS